MKALSPKLGISNTHDTAYGGREQMDARGSTVIRLIGRKVEIEVVRCIVRMLTASNKVDAAEDAVGSDSWLQHPRGLGEDRGMCSQ
jgi:hypothetical protein